MSEGSTLLKASASKTLYKTASPFEHRIGYYRGVRHGAHIFISGTTAVDPASPASAPQIQFPGDARQQTRVAFQECIRTIEALGGTRESVVRVRMFVSRHQDCAEVGRVFREMLARKGDDEGDGAVGAAATMIVVRDGFVDADMLIEVEMDAIVA